MRGDHKSLVSLFVGLSMVGTLSSSILISKASPRALPRFSTTATQIGHTMSASERVISINGFSWSAPMILKKDPVHKDITTYISLLDLEGTLGAFGIDTYWSGKSLTLVSSDLTVTGSTKTKNPYPIYMNGHTIGTFPNFVNVNGDIYFPLYYVMDALSHIKGFKTTWDGRTWDITNRLVSYPAVSDDTNSVWKWTGTWTDFSTSSIPSIDISNVSDKSFEFDFDGGKLTGTAHWSGNAATFSDARHHFSVVFTRVYPGVLTVYVRGGWNNSYFSSQRIPEIRGVYHMEPIQAILSVTNNVATLTGRSSLPVGTTLHIEIQNIYWTTTVQPGGQVQTREPISCLDNGSQVIQAWLTASGSVMNYLSNSNTLSTVVDHQSLPVDVTRFYQPGTPEYALSEFAATDNGVINTETANAVRDVDSVPFRASHFYPQGNSSSWIVIDGIDIYNVENTSETAAIVRARIMAEYVSSPNYSWDPGNASVIDTPVNLTKVNGQWMVDVTDLANALLNHS